MRLMSKIQSVISVLLTLFIVLGVVPIPVFSQDRPVVISFGQPNIWSLEQAHYLLARMHRQNLDLQTAALGDLDPNAQNASRIEILKTLLEAGVKFDDATRLNNQLLRNDKVFNSQRRQDLLTKRSSLQAESTQLARDITTLKIAKANAQSDEEKARIQAEIDAKTEQKAAVDNQVEQTNGELEGLTGATGNFTSVEPQGSFDSTKLSGDLDDIIKRLNLTRPSIAASLQLDNHIQMQYEIISKQLTLLRDEVGSGERLVFLELPQSINATQDRAENKVAQVWWRIAGYTRVDQDRLLELELQKLGKDIEEIALDVQTNKNLFEKNQNNRNDLNNQFNELCEKRRVLIEELERARKLPPEKRDEVCSKITRDLDHLEITIKTTAAAIQAVDEQATKLQRERARLAHTFTGLTTKYEKMRHEQVRKKIRHQQDAVDRLLQGGSPNTSEIVRQTIDLLNQTPTKGNRMFTKAEYRSNTNKNDQEYTLTDNKGREFVSLVPDEDRKRESSGPALLRNRLVRTIDVIPRQNAVNVNDTKQRVSKTGIFAALSFLFGFGGKFGYQKQREQAEQFLNQELFTSGFGKGETDFGWTFYPFAGTKQLAPGIRTTYAVAVIPRDAETIVLKARGCYFPRKENQPVNYDMAGDGIWTNGNLRISNCGADEQVFVLPVPGGSGDGGDFYVTGLRFSPHRRPGERIVVSIQGQNLPTQMGILINGVPLTQSVGLGQIAIESVLQAKVRENCVGEICGRFERVDSNQVVIAFNMPAEFKRTPRIALIGPGKEVELNKLSLNINGNDDTQLDSTDDWFFGERPTEASRSITDFKVAPDPLHPNWINGVLSGGKFKDTDTIYVNGIVVKKPGIPCERPDLCIVPFVVQGTDFLTVTVSPQIADEEAVSRTFVNPTNLTIISGSVVSSDKGDKDRAPRVTVKLDGSGFKNTLNVDLNNTGTLVKRTVPSTGLMILEIASPSPVVQIILTDNDNNKTVSIVIASPV